MRVIQLMLWVGLFILTIPNTAQDTQPIDPHGDYTETYTMDNITLNYPTGMQVSHESHQITLNFGSYSDRMVIAPPAMFDYFGIANHTPEVALRTMYRTVYQTRPSMYTSEIAPRFDVIKHQTTLAGVNAMTFDIQYPRQGIRYIAYTFEARGEVYGVMLLTFETNFVRELEIYVLERIIGSMMVDGEPLIPNFEVLPYGTLRVLNRPIPPAYPADDQPPQTIQMDAVTMQYPADWVLGARYPASAIFASRQELLDKYLSFINQIRGEGQFFTLRDDDIILVISPMNLYKQPITDIIDNYVEHPSAIAVFSYYDSPIPRYYIPLDHPNLPNGSFYLISQLNADSPYSVIFLGIAGDYDEAESVIFAILDSLTHSQ